MEEIRSYRIEEESQQRAEDDRREFEFAGDDDVPFHIPRD